MTAQQQQQRWKFPGGASSSMPPVQRSNPTTGNRPPVSRTSTQPPSFQGGSSFEYPESEQFTPPDADNRGYGSRGLSRRESTSHWGKPSAMNRSASEQETEMMSQFGHSAASTSQRVPMRQQSTGSSAHGRGRGRGSPSDARLGPPISSSASYSGYEPPPQVSRASSSTNMPSNYSSSSGSSSRYDVDAPSLPSMRRSSSSLPLAGRASNVPGQTVWGTQAVQAPAPGPSVAGRNTFSVHTAPGVPPDNDYPSVGQRIENYPEIGEEWGKIRRCQAKAETKAETGEEKCV